MLTIGPVDGAPGATVTINASTSFSQGVTFEGKLTLESSPSEENDVATVGSILAVRESTETAAANALTSAQNALIARLNTDAVTIATEIDSLEASVVPYVGATGPQGASGVRGDDGVEGVLGDFGPTGPVGPDGDEGLIGELGPAGDEGDAGDASEEAGVQGPVGAAGSVGQIGQAGVAGPRGAAGPTGPIGPDGPTGPQGLVGEDSGFGGELSVNLVPSEDYALDLGEAGVDGRRLRNVYAKSLVLDGNTLVFENGISVSSDGSGSLILPARSLIGGTPLTGNGIRIASYVASGPLPAQNISPSPPSVLSEDGLYNIGDFVVAKRMDGKLGLQVVAAISQDANKYLFWENISNDLTGAKGPVGPAGQSAFQVGEKGATGPSGPQGNVGLDGERGVKGPGGFSGPQGATGPQGVDGAEGPAGDKGVDGAGGEKGVAGPTGPTGPKGDRGVTGATGPVGVSGARGSTGVAGPRGATGPTGPVGPDGLVGVGPTGPVGATGPIGVEGAAGEPGATGPQGETGPQGVQGVQGVAGQSGWKGQNGVDGPIGEIGEKGQTGPDGVAGAQGEVGPSGTYGDKVVPQKWVGANRALYWYTDAVAGLYSPTPPALRSLVIKAEEAYDPAYSWIVADSAKAPTTSNGSGWQFTNTSAGQKINYYFMDTMPSELNATSTTAQIVNASRLNGASSVFRAGNFRSFFVVVKLLTLPSPLKFVNVFLAMYSAPGNTIGGYANKSSWYRSRKVLTNANTPAGSFAPGATFVLYTGVRPDSLTYVGTQTPMNLFTFPGDATFVELTNTPSSSLYAEGAVTDFNVNNDVIYRMSLGTNSAATVNTVSIETLQGGYVFGNAAFSVKLQ